MGTLLIIAAAGWLLYKFLKSNDNKSNGNTGKKEPDKGINDHYWNLKREIMKAVWNDESKVVDWKIWHDREDDLTYGGAPMVVLQSVDDDFRWYGRQQIDLIKTIIQYYFLDRPELFDSGIEAMKKEVIFTGINVNLNSMFSFKNGEWAKGTCPPEVTEYQEKLKIFDYPYDERHITREKCREIIDLGEKICSQY